MVKRRFLPLVLLFFAALILRGVLTRAGVGPAEYLVAFMFVFLLARTALQFARR